MTSTATAPETAVAKNRESTMALRGPRLPYHPAIEERFGVDKASWKALVEAIFPNATCTESVILALSYCRARKLDPFKRNVHIVPIWNKDQKAMVDTIWPGIGELRTTAFRTGEYAGRGETVYGPDVTRVVGKVEMTFPEWAQVTVCRMVKGQKVDFCGPRVYWIETYATARRDDDSPNEMWKDRPRGQIEKCAEAAALRAAFPEEIGCDYIPEEIAGGNRNNTVDAVPSKPMGLSDLTEKLKSGNKSIAQEIEEIDPPAPKPSAEIDSDDNEQVDDQGEVTGGSDSDSELREAAAKAERLDALADEFNELSKGDKQQAVGDLAAREIDSGRWSDSEVVKIKTWEESAKSAIRSRRPANKTNKQGQLVN